MAKVGGSAAVTAAASAKAALRRKSGGGRGGGGGDGSGSSFGYSEYNTMDLADQDGQEANSAPSYLEGMDRWGGESASSVLSGVGGPWGGRGGRNADADQPVTQYQNALADPTDNVGVLPSRANRMLSRIRGGSSAKKADRDKDTHHQVEYSTGGLSPTQLSSAQLGTAASLHTIDPSPTGRCHGVITRPAPHTPHTPSPPLRFLHRRA